MAGVLQLVTKLANVNGMPADETANTINVGFPGADPAQIEITSALQNMVDFWRVDTGPMAHWISWYISEVASRAVDACSVTAYYTNDLTGATPLGSPVGQQNFQLLSPGGEQQLPEEVAVVVSYHGDLNNVPLTAPNPTPPPAVIRPQQRRRGRMFIGPLGQQCVEDGISSIIPSLNFRTDLGLAFAELCNAMALDTTGQVSVWSKADAATYPVVGGWVDDAWDTQRRRGLPATQRTLFVV